MKEVENSQLMIQIKQNRQNLQQRQKLSLRQLRKNLQRQKQDLRQQQRRNLQQKQKILVKSMDTSGVIHGR